jgi:hypothetical protein
MKPVNWYRFVSLGEGEGRYELFVGCGLPGGGKLIVGFGLGVGIVSDGPLVLPPQPAAMATQTSAKRTSVFRCADVTKRAYTSIGEILVGKGPGLAHSNALA